MNKSYTKDNVVYIPTICERTGESKGEAKVDIGDGHLAEHEPWYFDESGVYAIVRVLGADVKIYMHDVVGARAWGGRVAASGILLPRHEEASPHRPFPQGRRRR